MSSTDLPFGIRCGQQIAATITNKGRPTATVMPTSIQLIARTA
ncbi:MULTISPECIES: hypothetical protein [Nocardia]|nr:hypothetical protein [Nocardia sputorum]